MEHCPGRETKELDFSLFLNVLVGRFTRRICFRFHPFLKVDLRSSEYSWSFIWQHKLLDLCTQLHRTACLLDAWRYEQELNVGVGGILVKLMAQWPILFQVNVLVYEVAWESSVSIVKRMFWLILFIWSRHLSKVSGLWRRSQVYHPRRETSRGAYESFARNPSLKLAKTRKESLP